MEIETNVKTCTFLKQQKTSEIYLIKQDALMCNRQSTLHAIQCS